jgi:uncharacterized protein (DUF849 family)
MSRKVVVTCAVTGSADSTGKNPAVPVTPEEIAASAVDAARAGAAIVHVHVRDPETRRPSMAPEFYAEVCERIRGAGTDVVINLTSGPGARFVPGEGDPRTPGEGTTLAAPDARMRHVEQLRPEICSLDVGSMNFGETVFMNTPAHLRDMAARAKAAGVKPEIEVFDTGMIELAKSLIAAGLIETPPLFQICLGISYGAPATTESMLHMRNALPDGANWSGFGISRMQFPMVSQAVLLGGNVRVGLEDNLYLGPGELAPSNAALVERAVRIIELMGASVASPAEARDIFGLPAR